jgi:hypothetical protein
MAVIATFLVLIASFAISLWSAWQDRRRRIDTYLYSGNTEILGISSCIGSVVSMAVSFTALLSAGYVWGWQILFSIVPGCLVGLALLLYLSRHPLIADHQEAVERQELPDGTSYISLFASRKPRLFGFYVFFLLAYTAMLMTELTVLRTFMESLVGLPGPELALAIGVIAFVCFAYVFIGGFRGVLVTDYFQLLVVIAFVGVWLASLVHSGPWSVPGPTTSRLHWTTWRILLLHTGCFSGALAWTFASVDQWYRTFGTLPVATARRVAVTAAATLCLMVAVPVLAGSSALLRHDVPPAVSNGISLFLVRSMTRSSPAGIRFLFVMALVCAALTTLNTYLITIQQLYYEFSIRLTAGRFWTLVATEIVAKWKNVRTVSLVLLIAAFVGSLFMPERYVYAFGVLSLSTFVLGVPLLINELPAIAARNPAAAETAWARRAHVSLWIAIILWVASLVVARLLLGSITEHLYVIPAAAAAASLVGSAIVLISKTQVTAKKVSA